MQNCTLSWIGTCCVERQLLTECDSEGDPVGCVDEVYQCHEARPHSSKWGVRRNDGKHEYGPDKRMSKIVNLLLSALKLIGA